MSQDFFGDLNLRVPKKRWSVSLLCEVRFCEVVVISEEGQEIVAKDLCVTVGRIL